MTPNLLRAIMIRSKLHDKFLKEKGEVSGRAYTKQRNYCINLLRKTKK